MLVEWEVTLKCNYKCGYCTNLENIDDVLDKDVLEAFIVELGKKHPGVEVFVFGGEPFLHPQIDHIIECFNKHGIPFVIQTNFSKKSVAVMKRITSPFKVQISIHPTEVKLSQLRRLFDNAIDIRTIDVMYTGKAALEYYFKVRDLVDSSVNLFLTPISDFGDGISNIALMEFNRLRKHPVYSKIVRFESEMRFNRLRSEVWIDPEFDTFGKPCLYDGKYFLYGPNLKMYNCCYRKNHTGMCEHHKCFLM